MLFSDKEKLLELYNALNNSNYTDPDDLEITTLDDVLYMNMKNDVSILLDDYLSLYEHQSTLSENIPFRGFLYFSEMLRPLIGDKRIYSRRMIELPTPVYIVFYNGDETMGEREEKRLSTAFKHGNEQSKMELAEAITQAIEECIRENVLRDFLMRRKKEVINSILTQYDEEEVMKMISKESYEDGVEYGMQVGEERGMKIGEELGETRFKILAQKLTEADRLEDLKRALSDARFCDEMYREFRIK